MLMNSFCILSWIFNCSYNSVCLQRLSNIETYDTTIDLLLEYTDKPIAVYESSFVSSFTSIIIHSFLSTNIIVILLFKPCSYILNSTFFGYSTLNLSIVSLICSSLGISILIFTKGCSLAVLLNCKRFWLSSCLRKAFGVENINNASSFASFTRFEARFKASWEF